MPHHPRAFRHARMWALNAGHRWVARVFVLILVVVIFFAVPALSGMEVGEWADLLGVGAVAVNLGYALLRPVRPRARPADGSVGRSVDRSQ